MYQQERKYIGDMSQLFLVKEYCYTSGKGAGLRAVDVANGSGLSLTVAKDRGMDLQYLSYKGVNLGFVTPAGVVAPQYYSDKGLDFLHSFTAGMLTTCGLQYFGAPCSDAGEELGLHGRISNTPAEQVGVEIQSDPDGEPVAVLTGTMREARLFGANLRLTREIRCRYRENKVILTDTVENLGFEDAEHMLLYHFNFGYPLVCESSKMLVPALSAEGSSPEAAAHMDNWNQLEPPQRGYAERVYMLKMARKADNTSLAGVYNPDKGLGLVLRFDRSQLDCLSVWKLMAEGSYVLGLEPGTAYPRGRVTEREAGNVIILRPGETRRYQLTLEILDGERQLAAVEEEIHSMG